MPENVPDCCCQMEIPFEFLDVKNHPTPTDLERNMSRDLVDVYLKTCTSMERVLFGRDKPLKGPGELWIDPNDRGDGKVKMTPLRTEKVQALTHQGILEIGKQIEVKMSEENKKLVEKAVQEAEELAKFEANQRIKFHVENETKKVEEEWKEKLNQLKMQHEKEIENVVKLYEEKLEKIEGKISTESVKFEQKESLMINSQSNSNIDEIKSEMEKKCKEAIDKELIHQTAAFQEQMENTLKNLNVNDRDRMEKMRNECLEAMDIQHHLMACKQITEIMQLLATQHKQNHLMKMDVKNEHESITKAASGVNPRNNQSKSIKHLWEGFLGRVDEVQNETLDSDEREILDKIQQIRNKLSGKECQICGDESDEILIISEPTDRENETNLKWLHHNINDADFRKISARPTVEWEKSEPVEIPTGNSFTSSLFNHILQPQQQTRPSSIPKTDSSIIKVARGESKLEEASSQDAIMKKLLFVDPFQAADVDIIPMSKAEVASITDSLQVAERRVSINHDEPFESNQLLSVVDSLELLSNAASRVVSKETSLKVLETFPNDSKVSLSSLCSTASLQIQIPLYMKPEKKSRGQLYAKMTQNEWEALKKFEEPLSDTRRTSVTFDEAPGSQRGSSRKSSILKNSSMEVKNEFDQEKNALRPIHEKCREALSKMNVEQVLKILCSENDEK